MEDDDDNFYKDMSEIDEEEKIYTCFQFLIDDESESTPFEPQSIKQSQESWGVYEFKPVSQVQWEKEVSEAASVAAQYHPYLPIPEGDVWAAEAL